jgi:hypothetical protein
MTLSIFGRGTTPRYRLTPKDFEGNPVIPTQTPICKVYDLENPNTPLDTLNVTEYETGKYEAYWQIPNNLDVTGHTVTCPNCGYKITDNKICYAEWAWIWDGKNFMRRSAFEVGIIEQ